MSEQTARIDPTNLDQHRAWDGDTGEFWVAHAERFNQGVARYHGQLLDAADLEPDAAVLDIGCGTGQTTRDAARRAADGTVLGVDLSEPQLRLARELAQRERLTNVRFEQLDAQRHPFRQRGSGQRGFDRAISRHGTMFFGDPVAAFTNIARALRPDARLVMLTWQPFERNEWIRSFFDALAVGRELPIPPSDAPSPFALSEPDRVRAVLANAGFTDVRLTDLREPMYFGAEPDDAAEFVLGMNAWLLRDLDPDHTARAIDALHVTLTEHTDADGVHYDSAAWLIETHRR